MLASCLELLFYPGILFVVGILVLVAAYFSEYLKRFHGGKALSVNLNIAGISWLVCAFLGKSFALIAVIAGEETTHYFEQMKAILPLIERDPSQLMSLNALIPVFSEASKVAVSKFLICCGLFAAGIPLMIALSCMIAAVIFAFAILTFILVKRENNASPSAKE